ncbi:MAG: pentapeptide repeat-containing protein [Prochloraceae cyanobacterium]
MTNWKHLVVLRKGIKTWNEWRQKHPAIRPDLSNSFLNGSFLRGANLRWVNLSGASLINADLRWANLKKADLRGAKLGGAYLNESSLLGANLSLCRAMATNFQGAIFTEACLQDWKINSETILDGVMCDYVYFKEKQQKRYPHSRNFAPREFTQLLQKSKEVIDLIVSEQMEGDQGNIISNILDDLNQSYIPKATVKHTANKSNASANQPKTKHLISKLKRVIFTSEYLNEQDKTQVLELLKNMSNSYYNHQQQYC